METSPPRVRIVAGADMQQPRPCGVSGNGVLFIERLRDRVRRVDELTGRLVTLSGGERGFCDGPAAKFAFPSAASLEKEGLLVADRDNRRIRLVSTTDGSATTVATFRKGARPCGVVKTAGTYYATVSDDNDGAHALVAIPDMTVVAGEHGSRGARDGAGTTARFSVIYDVAACPVTGRLYLADGNRIRFFDPRTTQVTTVAGSSDPGVRDGPAEAALFRTIRGIAVDGEGNVYASDFANNRVRYLQHNAYQEWTVRTLVGGSEDLRTQLSPPSLPCPCSLTLDDERGRLYVGTGDDFIVRVDVPSQRQRRRRRVTHLKLLFWLAHRHRAFLREEEDGAASAEKTTTDPRLARLLAWLVASPAAADLLTLVCDFAF